MGRGFKVISLDEWKKTMDEDLYQNIKLPKRSTTSSAGYDFFSPYDFVIKPNEEVVVKTGIKSYMNNGEVLLIFVRSSLGFKYNVRLKNQTGVIDADYFNNPSNEGHIMVALKNEGEKELAVKAGDRLVQGVFVNYLVSDDDEVITRRLGGIGSTNI